MCRSRRVTSVMKKLTPKKPTQTTAMAMSIGHSSSAYSLLCVMPERERERRGDDDHLPAPEVEPAEQVAEHPRLAEPLGGVVDRREDGVAREGEDHRVGVQRAQAAERDPLDPAIDPGEWQLNGQHDADQEPDHRPDERGGNEHADDRVVVTKAFQTRTNRLFGMFTHG